VNKCSYLPSSRQIQRKFGGLQKIKESLGIEITNFGKGLPRSKTATECDSRAKQLELEVGEMLITKFGKVNVHIEEQYGNSKNRVDFLVYNKSDTLAVDIFYPKDTSSFTGSINIKLKKYIDIPPNMPLYLVSMNPDISQEQINSFLNNKHSQIAFNIFIMNYNNFQKVLLQYL
jgi:hypothetical protein